jgi:raffinose/stachyose/melibiose transport system permease protein
MTHVDTVPHTGPPPQALAARHDAATSARTRRSRRRRNGFGPVLYLLPAGVIYGLFLLAPLGHTVWISFFKWDGLTPGRWVGLGNYSQALRDPELRGALEHSLILVGFYSALPILAALLVTAIMVRSPKLRGLGVARVILFLPQVVATVVIATLWAELLGPDGALNQLLDHAGLKALARPWLGDFNTALPAVGLIGTWIQTGFCLLLFLAGTAQIPRELYEAARVDGANAVREFFAVTLPGLRGQIVIAATLTVTAALRTFDVIYITTGGGPGTTTQVPAFEIYHRAFTIDLVGSACALGVLLTVIIFTLIWLITRLDKGNRL